MQMMMQQEMSCAQQIIVICTDLIDGGRALLFFDQDSLHVKKCWGHFSKALIINGPVKLLLFTWKMEVSIVLQLT